METFLKTKKETKLRNHNITARAALTHGSEAWVMKQRERNNVQKQHR